jgi:hypothetical protein
MKTIEIDDQTYSYLQANAIAFVETPGDVIKRLLVIPVNADLSNNVKTNELVKQDNSDTSKNTNTKRKKPKTNLPELIRAGLLKNGQRLFFQDYRGNRYHQYQVTLSSSSLIWKNNSYSMSDLAQELLNKHGYDNDFVRGPLFWITEEGKTVKELWDKYLNNR